MPRSELRFGHSWLISNKMTFTAIDFETATGHPESACAVGIVMVEEGVIVDEYYTLIQPPNN